MTKGVSSQCEALFQLENVIGALVNAEERLRVVYARIFNRLKTLDEADDLREIKQAQAAIAEAKAELAGWHPSALERKVGQCVTVPTE